ncbi:MAG: hypothetical protein JNM00_12210 [Flavobacteriales bacterium]|nr:hypothetical protein [Flavobacteriales bacterium]
MQDEKYHTLHPSKQNVSGSLNRFGTEHEDNNSSDFNFAVLLSPQFHEFFELADQSERDQWFFPFVLDNQKNCTDTKITDSPFIWGEVALPEDYADNNVFFPEDYNAHCSEGQILKKDDNIGMYGVLVTDGGHGGQPEMHPVQQYWFKDSQQSNDIKEVYWLFFVQDASDRFGNWIGSPLHGQFQFSFRYQTDPLSATKTPLIIDISLEDASDIVTREHADDWIDCDDGISHALVVDNKKMVVVNELKNSSLKNDVDNEMGIQFTELRRLSDGTIQGYAQCSMVIGTKETEPHGLAVLKVQIQHPRNNDILTD